MPSDRPHTHGILHVTRAGCLLAVSNFLQRKLALGGALRATTTLRSLFEQSFQANLITQRQRISGAAAAWKQCHLGAAARQQCHLGAAAQHQHSGSAAAARRQQLDHASAAQQQCDGSALASSAMMPFRTAVQRQRISSGAAAWRQRISISSNDAI